MKFAIIFILFFGKIALGTDTLKFGKSYPLKKVATYFNTDGFNSHVTLPSEYEKNKKVLNIKSEKIFKKTEMNIESEFDDFGNEILIKYSGMIDSLNIDSLNNQIYLKYFRDTVFVKKEELNSFCPIIKIQYTNLYFTDIHMVSIKNGVLNTYIIKNLNSGKLFENLPEKNGNDWKEFIIDELYYRKKDTVYRLNYQFVIIVH